MNAATPRLITTPADPVKPSRLVVARPDTSAADSPLETESILSPDGSYSEPEERLAMIAEAAYYRAEQRGFDPGHEIDDWLAAEAAIDAAGEQSQRPTACGD